MARSIARRLLLIACCLPLLGQDYGSGAPHVGGLSGAPPAAAAGCSQVGTREDFTSVADWTDNDTDRASGCNFVAVGGIGAFDLDAADCPNEFWAPIRDTDINSADQYLLVLLGYSPTVGNSDYLPGVILRGGGTDWYTVSCPAGQRACGTMRWQTGQTNSVSSSIQDLSCGTANKDGRYLGFKITGEGDLTEIEVWDFASDPHSSPGPTPDDWGDPTCTFTGNPVTVVNTGDFGGLWQQTTSGSLAGKHTDYDDFSVGSCN